MRRKPPRPLHNGFTLMEMVITVAVLMVLVKVATLKLQTPATMTLQAQTNAVADLIRRAQTLAMVRGERTRLSVVATGANGSLAVACPASAACVTDTGLTVAQGAVVGSGNTIYFNSLGQPVDVNGATLTADTAYTLSYATGGSTSTFTVTVAALTGRVSITP